MENKNLTNDVDYLQARIKFLELKIETLEKQLSWYKQPETIRKYKDSLSDLQRS